jgi:predicted metal-binding protein
MTTRIFVCVSCRQDGEEDDAVATPGQALLKVIESRLQSDGRTEVRVAAVECLAVCKRPCTVALCGADKWTYLIGDLDAEAHSQEIVTAALAFGASENGIIPWRERPTSFRKGVIARVPPLAFKGFPQ